MNKVNRVLNNYLGEDSPINRGKQMAAANIKELLLAIDPGAEIIPERNEDMLVRLLISIKGEALNSDERAIVREIVNSE